MKKFIYLTFILTTLMTVIFSVNSQATVEKPISFLQDDSKWGSKSYTIIGSRSQTIASSGCGPTSMAMVLNHYVDDTITPVQTANFAIERYHRTRNDGTAWSYFKDMANEYDLDFLQTASSVEALEWMNTKRDPLIICAMGPGLWTSRGHFILLWNVKNGVASINDPASTKQIRLENSYKRVASQCRQFFCFDRPKTSESFLFNDTNALSAESSLCGIIKQSPVREVVSPYLYELMQPPIREFTH